MPRVVIIRYLAAFQRPSEVDGGHYGLAGPMNQRLWNQDPSGASQEEFADTFLAWVFDQWEITEEGIPSEEAQARIDFMNLKMPLWVNVSYISN